MGDRHCAAWAQGRWARKGPSAEGSRGGAPSTVEASRYVTGYLPSLGLSLLIGKIGVKIKETRCPSLPGTSLIQVSILLVYLVDSPMSLSEMSWFGQ